MPCRRIASLQGVASSSRCGEFHCTDQPRKAASTKRVWKSMRTGASSTEKNISRSMLRVTRITPPKPLAPLAQISITLSSLGRNNRVRVVENNAMAFSGCHCGQIGNSCRGSRKYCGSISWCTASSAVESTRKKNHNGADR